MRVASLLKKTPRPRRVTSERIPKRKPVIKRHTSTSPVVDPSVVKGCAMYLPKPNDFYTLIEAMPLCIILHDAQSKEILWANAAALAALGFTLEELTPLKAPDMTRNEPKYRRSVGLRWLEGAARTGQRAIEVVLSLKQGVEILSEAVATLVHLEGRDVLMVQFRDISKEDRVKRDLKRFESRLKAFMQDLAEGVAVLGPDGEIRFISDSGAHLLHSEEPALIGENFPDLVRRRFAPAPVATVGRRDTRARALQRPLPRAAT